MREVGGLHRENFSDGRASVRAVTTPYRNETDALRERKETLEQELARLKQQTSELEGLRTREKELENELASLAEKLGAGARKRGLPLLDQVRVASPCSASWDEMVGDDRVRFCLSCEKNVYNLSAMPREDAERLLQERVGGELCVRFYQRTDGTILTEDCPVGVRKKRRKKIALAVAGAGAMAFGAVSMLTRTECRHTMGEMTVQGQLPEPEVRTVQGKPSPTTASTPNRPRMPTMGAVAPMRTKPDASAPSNPFDD